MCFLRYAQKCMLLNSTFRINMDDDRSKSSKPHPDLLHTSHICIGLACIEINAENWISISGLFTTCVATTKWSALASFLVRLRTFWTHTHTHTHTYIYIYKFALGFA